ncbi:MAG: DNA internalization-related competence protein ComEC/Rec2 [Dehalococcoidia bacterium]|nr:DNA internalization-related competence protein ComEC/Rec2 [Dehalococcoidia bacterium]
MILAWLAAAWVAGTAAAATLGAGAWPLAAAAACAMLALAVVRHNRAALLLALAATLVFVGAVLRFEQAQSRPRADAASRFNGGVAMRLRAVVAGDPRIGDTSQQLALRVRQVQLDGAWRQASGGVQVRLGLLPRYRSGDMLELEGALARPQAPGGFDYAAYLDRRGIQSEMQFPAARLVGHARDAPLTAATLAVRRRLSRALALALPEPQASLAQGVLLGQRSALPADVAADLNSTNTSHLVVVSGENVVLVSTYTTIALAWLLGRRRALALSIALVVAYALLVGASPPVLRATIMGVLLVVAQLSGRPMHGLTSILFAAALMAGIEPRVIADVSFQLTFAATVGIVYLASPLRRRAVDAAGWLLRRDELPRWAGTLFAEPLSVTLAAIVATAPLLALNFGRLSLVAVPANLLVVPVFPVILGASLLAAIGCLVPHLHLALAAPAYYALTYWLFVARRLAAVPYAALSVGGYSTPWSAATYASIVALAWLALRHRRPAGRTRLAPSRPLRHRALVAGIGLPALVLAVSVAAMARPSAPARLRVTVLDVGEGDSILIQTPGGRDVLVDGGPGRATLRGLGKALPWNDRSLELVVLTHPQADHMIGLPDVLDRYDVRAVLAGPGTASSAGYDAWLRAVQDEGRTLQTARQGMSIDLGGGARMDVLAPDAGEAADSNVNNTGVVLRVSWRKVSFLLAADIEAKTEQALLADSVDLRSTVLKVAHHGSNTSSTAAFLAAVQPQMSVVSAGARNPFGHPRPDVVARLAEYGPVYVTATEGAVRFETDGARLWLRTGR